MEMSNTEWVAGLVEDKCDPGLGAQVQEHLQSLGLETGQGEYYPKQAFKALREGIYLGYKFLGLDVDNDPSIQDTPTRFAKMFVGELTKGLNYDFFPKCTATPNGVDNVLADQAPEGMNPQLAAQFNMTETIGAYNQAVIVEKIRTVSLCEHHLQTIDGFTHIAYVPGPKVLGLSKFARITEFFAARPQIQERMTEQIHAALAYILGTNDVAVCQEAVHFCMRARGVKQPESQTRTNKLSGRFMTNPALREEFFDAIR